MTKKSRRRLKKLSYNKLAAVVSATVFVVVGVQVLLTHAQGTTNIPIPSSGAYWGITRDQPSGLTSSQRETAINNAESEIGRKFDYDRQFYKWGDDPFIASSNLNSYLAWSSGTAGHYMDINLVATNRDTTSAPFTSWAVIASGSQDGYLTTLAHDIKAWGKPAFFTFQHEPEVNMCNPDGSNASTCYGSAQDYINAWQHVVTVFRSNGVNNLSYVWQTTAYRWGHPDSYRNGYNTYPGAGYIDWIATDPFNANNPWQDMSSEVSSWYSWAKGQDKPLMIGAFGSLEQPGNTSGRASWFASAEAAVKAMPQVKALMYYDNNPSGTSVDDWRLFVDNPPATGFNQTSLNAYKAWGADTYFNTRNCNVSNCPGYPAASPTPPPAAPASTATTGATAPPASQIASSTAQANKATTAPVLATADADPTLTSAPKALADIFVHPTSVARLAKTTTGRLVLAAGLVILVIIGSGGVVLTKRFWPMRTRSAART